ncbi:MAG TPA: hypothetical protein VGO29_08760 [Solirubrobacteraceae bacterium]|jgi:hypothetical protein|nr:hypothetical protein [Solirubrobacteraceae bacterium]
MTGHHLEIQPLSRHRWIVRYEGDPTPLSQHATLTQARAEARNHARQFGEPTIHVHELDGECHTEHVDPDFRAPTSADVKGPHVEP